MDKEKSLFERIGDISMDQAKQEALLNEILKLQKDNSAKIDSLDKQVQSLKTQSVPRYAMPSNYSVQKEPPLKTFARTAKKCWRWFGSYKEFGRAKAFAILTLTITLLLGITSIILTCLSTSLFSPFSFLELSWVIIGIVLIAFASNATIVYEVNDFASHSILHFDRDKDTGMLFPYREKAVYKVFRWITFISIVGNIILIWIRKSDLSVAATIVEVLLLASMIASLFVNLNLHAQYCIGWFEGKNEKTGEKTTLVKMPGFKNFLLEKDVREKIPQLFER